MATFSVLPKMVRCLGTRRMTSEVVSFQSRAKSAQGLGLTTPPTVHVPDRDLPVRVLPHDVGVVVAIEVACFRGFQSWSYP
jgi:hypothetical protein